MNRRLTDPPNYWLGIGAWGGAAIVVALLLIGLHTVITWVLP